MSERDRNGGRTADNNRNERGGNDRNDRRGGGRNDRRNQQQDERSQYIERVVTINRVSKVVKGGRRFSFTALVIVGDGQGMVGVGYGKAKEVPSAIQKGAEEARKNFFRVPMIAGTITHPVQGEAAAGVVMMKPAAPVPVSSPVAPPARCSSAPVSRTCCRSRSAPTTPSTSSTPPWTPSSSWSAPRRSPPVVARPSRRSRRLVCCAPAPQDRERDSNGSEDHPAQGHRPNQAEPA